MEHEVKFLRIIWTIQMQKDMLSSQCQRLWDSQKHFVRVIQGMCALLPTRWYFFSWGISIKVGNNCIFWCSEQGLLKVTLRLMLLEFICQNILPPPTEKHILRILWYPFQKNILFSWEECTASSATDFVPPLLLSENFGLFSNFFTSGLEKWGPN